MDAAPLTNWREQASLQGWTEQELQGFESLLNSRHHTCRVTEVLAMTITVVTEAVLRIEGLDVAGNPQTRMIHRARSWVWRKHPMPALKFHDSSKEGYEARPWCPAHAYACPHTPCSLVINHPGSVVEVEYGNVAYPDFDPPPKEVPVASSSSSPLSKPLPKKPKHKKGKPLPGQMAFSLEPAPTKGQP